LKAPTHIGVSSPSLQYRECMAWCRAGTQTSSFNSSSRPNADGEGEMNIDTETMRSMGTVGLARPVPTCEADAYIGPERRSSAGRRRTDLSPEQQLQILRTIVDFNQLAADAGDPVTAFVGLIDCAAALHADCDFTVTLIDSSGEMSIAASSSEAVRLLTERQIDDNEGPLLDSHTFCDESIVYRLSELEGRWPRFRPLALAIGYQTTYHLPLRTNGELIGMFSVYDHGVNRVGNVRLDLLLELALAAARGLSSSRMYQHATSLAAQLQQALNSRVVIEQAKGITAARLALDPESAFNVLRRYSRNHGVRLHDVAVGVIEGKINGIQLREVTPPKRHAMHDINAPMEVTA